MGMDDINFDELDNAVKSVLQQTPEKVERQEPKSDVIEQPNQTEGVATEQRAPSAAVRPTSVVVSRSRGQFMDMVHPSSDMTTPPVKQEASTTASRFSNVMKPLDPSIVEISKNSPEEPAASRNESVSDADLPREEECSASPYIPSENEWPDPIDSVDAANTHNKSQRDEPMNSEAPEASRVNKDSLASVVTSSLNELETEDALDSPFIKGTEVEKRPLSAFAETADQEGEAVAADDESPYEGNIPEAVVTALPQELAPEVVSVESDNPSNDIEELQPAATSPDVLVSSISQQYKPESAPADDDATHPVFDTKEYHQPLTPPAKKKHTGLTIVFTLLLLALLGAGVWYAVFVLKLI